MTDVRANRTKWVKALRSGKYEQAKGVLHNGTGYCCLGVLCVVAGMTPERDEDEEFRFDGNRACAPEIATRFVGLRTNNGGYKYGDHALTEKNDAGMTFNEIADLIESEPDGLFKD